ncbi:MAG: glycosyl hydrolase family 5 [Fibrobacter sp.]|nr:glycosyl hydrolase family 5 [Fibrobacter sp.]
MKAPFLKSVLVLSSALALLNCGDDTTTTTLPNVNDTQIGDNTNPGQTTESPVANACGEACWVLKGDKNLIINQSMIVYDENGFPVGTYDAATGSILAANGTTVLQENVALEALPVATQATVEAMVAPAVPASSTTVETPASSSSVDTTPKSSANVDTPKSSSSVEQPKSSSSVKQEVTTDGNVTITGNLKQTVAQNASTGEIKFSGLSYEPSRLSWNAYFLETSYSNGTYTIKAITVPEYFQTGETSEFFKVEGKDYEIVLNVTAKSGSSNNNNQQQSSSSQQQQQKSSSSVAKSSSSQQQQKSSSSQQVVQPKSSSSSAQPMSSYSYGNTAAGTDIKPVAGGKSGSGWATRYWDCCKPHCAWPGKGGIKATACDAKGNKISDDGATSMCDGGNSGTCTSQIPMVVNDKLAYAYAAVPAADGASCGKCYALKFTGKGKYETKANHKALAGKTLIVMTSNVGADVSQGQFDIMIPGGGVGLFNGCRNMGWGDMGATYGGLLTDCEKEVGYSGDLLTKRKECLANKCNKTFSNDPVAKEGCMFLATWYEAAGNPTHEYQEVECPAALKNKF